MIVFFFLMFECPNVFWLVFLLVYLLSMGGVLKWGECLGGSLVEMHVG